MGEAWIIDGVRSPRGKGKSNGSLHHIHPQELLAQVLNALADRTGIDKNDVDDVIIGNGNPSGDHGACIGRMAVLAAGWPVEAPGVTLNRFCGSGQQAVTFAAMGIQAGHQQLVVGGGVESMSRWPVDDAPARLHLGQRRTCARCSRWCPRASPPTSSPPIEGFTRDDVDAFAVESQDRAAKAIAEGALRPQRRPDPSTPTAVVALDHDEYPRPGTTLEGLAKLTASFADDGRRRSSTASTAASTRCAWHVYPRGRPRRPRAPRRQLVRRRRRRQRRAAGLAGVRQGARPHAAGPHRDERRRRCRAGDHAHRSRAGVAEGCLERAGMTVDDIDLWEINEAFAAIPMKTIRDLGIDPAKVNVNGGAIALGHPIGATGGMLIQTALDELERRDLSTALITMCTGGGMGTATIIERI